MVPAAFSSSSVKWLWSCAKPIRAYPRACLTRTCRVNFRAELNLTWEPRPTPGTDTAASCYALCWSSDLETRAHGQKRAEVHGAGTYTQHQVILPCLFLFINSLIFPHAAICRKHTLYMWDFSSCCQGSWIVSGYMSFFPSIFRKKYSSLVHFLLEFQNNAPFPMFSCIFVA